MSPGAVRADGAEDWSRVRVDLGERGYDILIGQGLLTAAGRHIAPALRQPRLFVVTDETVAALHLEAFARALDAAGVRHETYVLPSGEKSKSFAQLAELIDAMLAGRVERATTVAALGGGVVGDLAGFAASVALRGLDYVQVPTTLLAQVDSSVGGKTGINTARGKNLVGSFHQPRLVLADTGVLDTLPQRELLAGYAEVVKYGLLGDAAFFAWLERQGAAVIAGDPAARRHAITTCCRAKAAIVAADEREGGARALLNLGHTFAHALEAEARYEGVLLHGEAVAAGMALAFELSAALGLCPAEDARRARRHLSAIGLPDGLAALSSKFDADALIAHMAADKKMRDGRLSFVLARGIGDAFLCADVGADSVRAVLRSAA